MACPATEALQYALDDVSNSLLASLDGTESELWSCISSQRDVIERSAQLADIIRGSFQAVRSHFKRQREAEGDADVLGRLDAICSRLASAKDSNCEAVKPIGRCLSIDEAEMKAVASFRGLFFKRGANKAQPTESADEENVIQAIRRCQGSKRKDLYTCGTANWFADVVVPGLPSPAAQSLMSLTLEAQSMLAERFTVVDTKLEALRSWERVQSLVNGCKRQLQQRASLLAPHQPLLQLAPWIRLQHANKGVARLEVRGMLLVDMTIVCIEGKGTTYYEWRVLAHGTRWILKAMECDSIISAGCPVAVSVAAHDAVQEHLRSAFSKGGLYDGCLQSLRAACGVWLEIAEMQCKAFIAEMTSTLRKDRTAVSITMERHTSVGFEVVLLLPSTDPTRPKSISTKFYLLAEASTVVHQSQIGTSASTMVMRDAIQESIDQEGLCCVDCVALLWSDWNPLLMRNAGTP